MAALLGYPGYETWMRYAYMKQCRSHYVLLADVNVRRAADLWRCNAAAVGNSSSNRVAPELRKNFDEFMRSRQRAAGTGRPERAGRLDPPMLWAIARTKGATLM